MSYNVEKDWVTGSGFRAVCIFINESGHRCGYVGIPKDNPIYGFDYGEAVRISEEFLSELKEEEDVGKRGIIPLFLSDINDPRFDLLFDVHGSITYSNDGDGKYPVEADLWWYGFDCAHCDDKTKYSDWGEERTMEYVIEECERLADQLKEREGHVYQKKV